MIFLYIWYGHLKLSFSNSHYGLVFHKSNPYGNYHCNHIWGIQTPSSSWQFNRIFAFGVGVGYGLDVWWNEGHGSDCRSCRRDILVCLTLAAHVLAYAVVNTEGSILSCSLVRGHYSHRCALFYNDQSFVEIWHEFVRKLPIFLNPPLIIGALLGASSVLLGAYGAHGLNDVFIQFPKMKTAYHNAVDYQFIHSLLLVILGISSYLPKFQLPRYLCWLLCLSILLFSFSIYVWVFGGPSWVIKLTPLGGTGFFLSWMLLIRTAWLNRKKE